MSRYVIVSTGLPALKGRAAIHDPERGRRLLSEAQRLRGRRYLEDGAIQPEDLDSEGRHVSRYDDQAYHLLWLSEAEEVLGCIRVNVSPVFSSGSRLNLFQVGATLDRLDPRESTEMRFGLAQALAERAIVFQPEEPLVMVVGGWAVEPAARMNPGLNFGCYWLQRELDALAGISVATERNHSHRILKKFGGRPIGTTDGTELFYDPDYNCRMGVLLQSHRLLSARHRDSFNQACEDFDSAVWILCSQPS